MPVSSPRAVAMSAMPAPSGSCIVERGIRRSNLAIPKGPSTRQFEGISGCRKGREDAKARRCWVTAHAVSPGMRLVDRRTNKRVAVGTGVFPKLAKLMASCEARALHPNSKCEVDERRNAMRREALGRSRGCEAAGGAGPGAGYSFRRPIVPSQPARRSFRA